MLIRHALRLCRIAAAAAVAFGAVTTAATAGGKFVFANSSAYDTLDPHAVFDVGRVASRINLYDGPMPGSTILHIWSRGWPRRSISRTTA